MEKELMAISDMYFVAILISLGHCYDHIDDTDPRRLRFMFPDEPSKVYILNKLGNNDISTLNEYRHIDQVQAAYTSGVLMYMPGFVDAIKRVKSVIHGKKRNRSDRY